MLKFGDKIIYIEGVLVEIRDDGSAAIDLKGRLGYLEIPQWMLLHEHPLVVGQEFGWNMSFPEQLGPEVNEKYVSNIEKNVANNKKCKHVWMLIRRIKNEFNGC